MRVAICDDNYRDLNSIKKFVFDYFAGIRLTVSIDEFQDADVLLKQNLKIYDFLILDVMLKNITGIQLAKKIRERNEEIQILFCSSDINYSIDAYDVKAFCYLMKPLYKEEFFRKLDNLMGSLKLSYIEIEDSDHIKRTININKILYIDVLGKRTIIHLLNNSSIITCTSLYIWEERFKNDFFVICYKGILVNIKNVNNFEKDRLILINKDVLYVSRRYFNNAKIKWFQYLDSLV